MTYGPDEIQPATGRSSKRLLDALQTIQEDPPPYAIYVMIAFVAATVHLAAHETGREVAEIVDELARSFDVT